MNTEQVRLDSDHTGWMRWGPYVAERAWGGVREDYSADGEAWTYFPYDHARSRTYRWNEDGMAGICDVKQRLCLALSLWNEADDHLKERMFGLTGPQGNHGEDVKEHWWYTDATPTHSWLEWSYAYPLTAFPYQDLIKRNAERGRESDEYELLDTGIFDPEPDGDGTSGRWVDVTVQYAKAAQGDIVMRILVRNVSAHSARLHVLPTLWFRNTWSWTDDAPKPMLTAQDGAVVARHPEATTAVLTAGPGPDGSMPRLLFCENETNDALVFGSAATTPFPKDGINDHVIHGADTVNPKQVGTKAAAHYVLELAGGGEAELILRLAETTDEPAGLRDDHPIAPDVHEGARNVLTARKAEADQYHAELAPSGCSADERAVHRAAVAGMIWCKQYYRYDVDRWLTGDPAQPTPPSQRLQGRNSAWRHVDAADVLSMPDSWEYPWFAAWDLAFHTVALAHIDPEFAKQQLILMLREWYMHPNGQLPAYEWSFEDVNPPVHAWAALRVFEIDGSRDHEFLERILHKLLLNFTWWVNRKDVEGNNIFEGGFLGMDNIGPIDRSRGVPEGSVLEQSDATSWMAMYCLDLLEMCLRLATRQSAYQDLAIKFLEHFAYVATAMRDGELWDAEDEFYYDVLTSVDDQGTRKVRMRVQSMVGLIPLFAVRVLPMEALRQMQRFSEHLEWFLENKSVYAEVISGDAASARPGGRGGDHLLAIVRAQRLPAILARLFDEGQFLAPTGIRSLSKYHAEHPFSVTLRPGWTTSVGYEPAESRSNLFGGNSNWRGPIWFPVNHLLVSSLRRYGAWEAATAEPHTVELPAGSGHRVSLMEAADEISRRLISTFLPGPDGVRPAQSAVWERMPVQWRDRLVFHEYFHGDTGAGLGASHQTGWTGLVIDQLNGLYRPSVPGMAGA